MDYGMIAQKTAEDHLAACWDAFNGEIPETVASAPFCGCRTCEVREILFAAWPIIRQGVLDEMTLPLYEYERLVDDWLRRSVL